MVYLAGLNLLLLLFDFTYLLARPIYVRHLPWVARTYDSVKGIEPHPVTSSYLAAVDDLALAVEAGRNPEPELGRLRRLSDELLENDPFALRRGADLQRVTAQVLRDLGQPASEAAHPERVRAAFARWWSGDAEMAAARLAVFDAGVRPVFEANYFRRLGPRGRGPVDWFWLLDLPFLLIFAGEFAVRWTLAVRRRVHRRWWHFPVFNFYDALGLLPWLRLFRLFRVVSIYLRLRRSQLTIVGDDLLSRAVRFVTDAITEEITDRVTIAILEAAQERIREGTYADIVERSLEPRRDAIRAAALTTFRDLLSSPRLREPMDELLRLHLEQAVESSEALRRLPFQDRLVAPLVNAVGMAVYGSLLRTIEDTLEGDEGMAALEQVVDTILDAVTRDVVSGDLQILIEEISMEILQRTKETVAVREWAGETWHDLVESYRAETGGGETPAPHS